MVVGVAMDHVGALLEIIPYLYFIKLNQTFPTIKFKYYLGFILWFLPPMLPPMHTFLSYAMSNRHNSFIFLLCDIDNLPLVPILGGGSAGVVLG